MDLPPTRGLVIDANVFAELLRSEDDLRRLEGSLRICGRRALITELNVIELLRTPDVDARRGLLAVAARLSGGRVPLPWPANFLQAFAHSAANGSGLFRVEPGIFDRLMRKPDSLTPRQREEIERNATRQEQAFKDSVTHAATTMRPHLKRVGVLGLPLEEFLQEWWSVSALEFAESDLDRLGVRGVVGPELLASLTPWRLEFESVGVAVHRQLFEKEQKHYVGRYDIGQMIYMSVADVFVTAESPKRLAGLAATVLHGRYCNREAIRWDDLRRELSS